MRRARLVLAVAALAVGCASAVTEGQLALRQGRYVEAEGFFNEALAKDPGRTDALVGLGIAQYKAGQVDQAIESLEKAVPIRPNEPSVRLYLALAYLKREDTEKAEQQLTALRSLKIDPRVGDLSLSLLLWRALRAIRPLRPRETRRAPVLHLTGLGRPDDHPLTAPAVSPLTMYLWR